MRLRLVFSIVLGVVVSLTLFSCETADDSEGITMDTTSTWVTIQGGFFEMGDSHLANSGPVHAVSVPTFDALRTEVTVAQYGECVNSGACTLPTAGVSGCNWGMPGFEQHPVNCVSWQQASDFCTWFGGRLMSEAEWEYAARAGGDSRPFPWGLTPPSCNLAVMNDDNGEGCGSGGTWPVCSKPNGRTDHGLCDMAGNVYEWVADVFHTIYSVDAPIDGSAWIDGGFLRVLRGAAYNSKVSDRLHVASRSNDLPDNAGTQYGIRCAR